MAVRFITPVETPYESQFVPMPLDFMYKALQEKQKGLDTTREQLGSADLNLDGAAWDIEQGNVAKKKSEYSGAVVDLTKKLSENKESFSQVAQDLKSVNRKFQNDAEVQRIVKHKEYFDKNVLPYLGKPNAASLYFRDLMVEDPETGKFKWKQGQDISLDQIRTPIEDKTTSHVMENFGKYLNASVKEKFGEGYSITTDPSSGMTVITKPGGQKVEDLNLNADYVRAAIKNYSRVLKSEETDQAHYMKEFLPNPITGTRGLKTEQDLQKFVTDVVSSRFYTKSDITPTDYKFMQPSDDAAAKRAADGQAAKDRTYAISSLGATPSDLDLGLLSDDITANSTMAAAKLKEADTQLFNELNKASTYEDYSPTLRSIVYSGADGNITGEGSFGIVLDQMLTEASKGVTDSAKKQKLVEVMNNPYTANMVITNPEYYLGKDGYFAKNGMTQGQIGAIKNNLYQQLIGISQDPGDDQVAFDVVKGIMGNYNESKSLQALAAEKQKVFDNLAGVITNSEDEKVITAKSKELFNGTLIQNVLEDYGAGNPSYTLEQINNDTRLQHLVEENILVSVNRYGKPEEDTGIYSFRIGQNPAFTKRGVTVPGDPIYTDGFNNATVANREKQQAIKEGKFSFAKELKVIKETTEGEKAGTLKAVSKEYLALLQSPQELANLLQQTAALVGRGGKDYRNKGTAKEVFESSLFKGKDFEGDKFEITNVGFEINNSGIPMIVLTAMSDKNNPDSFSQVSLIYDNKNNPTKYANIVSELLTDDAPEYRDVGAAWYASAAIEKDQLGLLNLFFDAKTANQDKSVKGNEVIQFTDKKGTTYGIQTTNTGRVSLGLYEDGKIIPFTSTTTPSGKTLDPNDVKDYQEALVILGYSRLNQAYAKQTFGGQGGTSTVGKSPLQTGQLWTPK
jgi:hypothetical protein